MAVIDRGAMKEILKVTCSILQNNFYYSDEVLSTFLDDFAKDAAVELHLFEMNAEKDVINELLTNRLARIHFTCYFTSSYLRHIFKNKMHFTEKELIAFESIIPKCFNKWE